MGRLGHRLDEGAFTEKVPLDGVRGDENVGWFWGKMLLWGSEEAESFSAISRYPSPLSNGKSFLSFFRGPREPLEPLLLIIEFDRVLERFSPVGEGSNGMIRWSRSSEFSGSNRDNRKPAG